MIGVGVLVDLRTLDALVATLGGSHIRTAGRHPGGTETINLFDIFKKKHFEDDNLSKNDLCNTFL